MAVIFFHRVRTRSRSFLMSVAMPYLFILLLGLGLLVVTVVGTIVQTAGYPFLNSGGVLLYILGVLGLTLMLTAIYLVVPVGRSSFRHALVGGVSAGVLWEIARHLMVWYFRTLSMVNVVYGSFATAVLALLSLEVAAIILLLGAQVIAEFERLLWDGIPGSPVAAP
jgi:YihY family inner membrane protein